MNLLLQLHRELWKNGADYRGARLRQIYIGFMEALSFPPGAAADVAAARASGLVYAPAAVNG
jgi:hypothetical protein